MSEWTRDGVACSREWNQDGVGRRYGCVVRDIGGRFW